MKKSRQMSVRFALLQLPLAANQQGQEGRCRQGAKPCANHLVQPFLATHTHTSDRPLLSSARFCLLFLPNNNIVYQKGNCAAEKPLSFFSCFLLFRSLHIGVSCSVTIGYCRACRSRRVIPNEIVNR